MFTYCGGVLDMVSSTIMTSLLWVGGSNTSKYIPILGSRPTDYQEKNNRAMFETFAGTTLTERVIKRISTQQAFKTGDVLVSRRWAGF
jgi:hypothetical protein